MDYKGTVLITQSQIFHSRLERTFCTSLPAASPFIHLFIMISLRLFDKSALATYLQHMGAVHFIFLVFELTQGN